MFVRCVALAILTAVSVPASDVALTRIGDVWKFYPGVSEPSLSFGAWQQTGFDDSLWSTGRTGFSAGYAMSEASSLPDLPTPYSSAYFRRTFLLTNRVDVRWLTLRIDYCDGFVAYLNGEEIARRNLEGGPGTPIAFNRLATNFHSRSQPEQFDVSFVTQALISGLNTLAVQLHGATPGEAGLCFSAELLANFTRAPFVQNMSSNRVQVIWKTPVATDTEVTFGRTAAFGYMFLDTNLVTTHAMTLTNLAPDTDYTYQVSCSIGGQTARSDPATFHTFKRAGPLRFVAFGDGGWNSLAQYQLAEVIRNSHPDLVIDTGDVVYPSFTSALADPRCFSVYQPHMASAPYFFAIGNHDLYSGVTNYLDAFYLPTNSVSLTEHTAAGTSPEHYYSFDQGDAHFTVLFVPYLSQYRLTVGDPQYRWLTNDLAVTRQPWKIAVWHVPMNSSSAHRFDDLNFNGIEDRLEVRDVLLPVLSRYGVQLALCGHEHGYERFDPTNGVHCITTAGGGAELYGFTELDVASALFWPRYNCLRVTIDGDTLEAQALGADGEEFDAMTIQRRLPAPRTYQATWRSPVVESAPANDGDGNILGQVFDFQGVPIPTLTGQFSNLGRAYVNNDRTNLYLGLERVMIYGNNNVFVFVDAPGLTGVTNLMHVGNGLIDPTGQGADGLDVLANLSFANFTPSVGCILGDELGDGQFRNFARTNLALNIGQGVFRLDAALSDVPGIRLQQFHLSPELGGGRGEENANFIELALPLAQLGGLRPGDLIRIGAVVGGAEFDLAGKTRFLDSGFLGNRLLGSGLGSVILEGVPVTLALDPDADDDGDGASNLQEWLAGTDPQCPDSVLRIKSELRPGRQFLLSWEAAAGRAYQIQSSDDSWTRFDDLQGAGFPASSVATNRSYALDLRSLTRPAQFYRLRLVP